LYFLPATRQAALPVGHKWRIDEMERSHLVAEARSWGMPDSVARATIASTLERLKAGVAAADEAFPEAPAAMRDVVNRQLDRLAASGF
jgi:hypothetical protein